MNSQKLKNIEKNNIALVKRHNNLKNRLAKLQK
jgi:hypothetical protein